jgi:type IV pilus biogenesis protein CpaD/CtpE
MNADRLLWGAMTALLAGCASTDRSPQGTTHLYRQPMDRVWKAIELAVSDLDFRFEENRHDDLGGMIKARRANGDDVVIRATSFEKGRTSVSVHAPSGDRTTEEAVLGRIGRQLEPESPTLGP